MMKNTTNSFLRPLVLVSSLAGCASSAEGNKQITTPNQSSAPLAFAANCATTSSTTSAPGASNVACHPRKADSNDPVEIVIQAVRQPYDKNVAIDYSGLAERHTPF